MIGPKERAPLTTLEGFLSQKPGDPPRMTAGQKDVVLSGARAALEAAYPAHAASGLLACLEAAVEELPSSTACLCCDFFRARDAYCSTWEDKVPNANQAKGCKHFQDMNCPF